MKHLSVNEKEWLKARFPKLEINENEKGFVFNGDLVVDMFYDGSVDEGYVIFPDKNVHSSDQYIIDCYQIRIEYCDTRFIPIVYETAGRLKKFARQRNMELADLHINFAGDLCLCPKPLEKVKLANSYTIEDFFKLMLIPFFYAQSYFEKYSKWPWKDYSHGDPGIVECFAAYISKVQEKKAFIENTVNSLNVKNQMIVRSADQITRQALCFCNSGNKFRNCHHGAWMSVKILKKYLNGSLS